MERYRHWTSLGSTMQFTNHPYRWSINEVRTMKNIHMNKKLLLLLLSIILIGCSNEEYTYNCHKGTIRILDKKDYHYKGPKVCRFYLYDGSSAYWCETNPITYDSYKVGDTLPTLVIIKTKKNNNEQQKTK